MPIWLIFQNSVTYSYANDLGDTYGMHIPMQVTANILALHGFSNVHKIIMINTPMFIVIQYYPTLFVILVYVYWLSNTINYVRLW